MLRLHFALYAAGSFQHYGKCSKWPNALASSSGSSIDSVQNLLFPQHVSYLGRKDPHLNILIALCLKASPVQGLHKLL